jgi:hypothetical protein
MQTYFFLKTSLFLAIASHSLVPYSAPPRLFGLETGGFFSERKREGRMLKIL